MLKAPAKINLTLSVTGKREDGFHLLSSVFQSVSLCDTVSLEPADHTTLTVANAPLPTDSRNTAYRAAQVFFAALGLRGGVRIGLTKQIPSAAGLGGGSSDAAAVIRGLNALYQTHLSAQAMRDLALSVGADVPFCVSGGTALVEGIGEHITPLAPLPECFIVIAKPSCGVLTRSAYEAVDKAGIAPHPASGILAAIAQQDLNAVGEELYNCFEQAQDLPEVSALLQRFAPFHPLGCHMTGSGSAVFALFRDKESAVRCAQSLNDTQHFLCMPLSENPKTVCA